MPDEVLARAAGWLSPHAFQVSQTRRLVHLLQAASGVKFDSRFRPQRESHDSSQQQQQQQVWAHAAGSNCLAIDRFEGRYMLSGGTDSSLRLWDLEREQNPLNKSIYFPTASIDRAASSHKYGITGVSFYPFDSLAFLTSSYDHALKICSTETFKVSASFDLESVIYSHALSPIASHLLVACATQHSSIRLVDLKSAVQAHSLPGHHGAVLSVAWSPKDEFVLASGGSDGTVRLWDVRRSAASLGVLDLEDCVGIGGEDGYGNRARSRHHGKAHTAACNGVAWKDDGQFLVTAGHDERVRVWNIHVGANALSHFGPIIKNTVLAPLLPLLVPDSLLPSHESVMFYPNEKEILMFDLFEGTLLKRLRIPAASVAQASSHSGQRNTRNRVTALAWRAEHVEMYSTHSDGIIRAWKAREGVENELDKDEEVAGVETGHDPDRKRKREALDQVFRDLTKQKITFT